MGEFKLFALFLSFTAFLFFAWKLNSGGKKNLPPSPPALPVIGNLHQLGQLPHRSLRRLSQKHGPLMLLHFGSKPTIVASSADVAKEILKTHDISFADKPVNHATKKIFYDLKDMIYLPYGDQWRKLRSVFHQELLSTARVKSYNSIREEEIALVVEKIKNCCMSSLPVNLTNMFGSLSNDLICRAAIGKKQSAMEYILKGMEEIVGLLQHYTLDEFVPWLSWINRLNGFNAALDTGAKKKDEFMDALIEEHLSKGPNPSGRENFADILLGLYKGNTPGVSIDLVSVKAVILDVFGAGTETSATTLVWIMTELIKNPAVMKKLQEEIRGIMKGREQITDDDIQNMHYMKAVVKETLRFRPTVPIYVRAAKEDVKLMGYDIPAKTTVLINAWAIGRDPAYWDEPEKFMPERFLNSSVDFKGLDFQLIPFGAGRRICPGLTFAATSIEHILANLVYRFDWALPDGEVIDVTEKPGISVGKKHPLSVVPTPASSGA